METQRLIIDALTPADAAFIFALTNSPGWLQFIGNRNITDHAAATAYILRILDDTNVQYFVVRLKTDMQPLGVITIIRRDRLPCPDIGFAFLPQYEGAGYAREAATAVLAQLRLQYGRLCAITLPDNHRSVKLLEALGFTFVRRQKDQGSVVALYMLPA